jgi:hypothetical protein
MNSGIWQSTALSKYSWPSIGRLSLLVLALGAFGNTCRKTERGAFSEPTKERFKAVGERLTIDSESFDLQIKELTIAPHPFGSARQREVAQFIRDEAEKYAAKVHLEEFDANIPNPELMKNPQAPAPLTLPVKGINVHASAQVSTLDQCVIILASHYDTKILEGADYVGANDSGSSSILLLQLMRQLVTEKIADLRCEIWFTWFDGEESSLPNWTDGETIHPARMVDHTYGSRHFASRLVECPFDGRKSFCMPSEYGGAPVIAVIVVDMIGSPDLRFTREMRSTPALRSLMTQAVALFGEEARLAMYREIEDDHIPFLQRGVPALNLIDFENLTHWHQPTDVPANLSAESIRITGKIVSYLALSLAAEPQVILQITE